MNATATLLEVTPQTIEFTLDGRSIHAYDGETLFKAAKRHGVDIPHLCYKDSYRPDGNCRACVVEIKGERTLAPSCCRSATAGMDVQASSERAVKSQKMVLEMLLSDMPDRGYKWNDSFVRDTSSPVRPELVEAFANPSTSSGRTAVGSLGPTETVGQHGELSHWASRMNVKVRPEFKALRREQPAADVSHPAMAVNLDTCIQCNLCLRACREVQVNDVIGFAFRGAEAKIVFDLDDPMGDSTCVACGECVQVCPTGALMPKTQVGSQAVDKKVDSVCPFCGVGCLLTYNISIALGASNSSKCRRVLPSNCGQPDETFFLRTVWLHVRS